MALALALVAHPVFLLNAASPAAALSEHELERHRYKRETQLLFFERLDFYNSYTSEAREELHWAVTRLVYLWRAYRNARCDRHIVPRSFANRFYRYQMRTYNKHLYTVGFFSVKNRICELDKFLMGPKHPVTGERVSPIDGNFEPCLLRYIAMFLLPSEEQHKPYYGYAGKSLGAQIDCTYEQPRIHGQICTKEELYIHNNPFDVFVDLLEGDSIGCDAGRAEL
tara:strand:+ start:1417 stop:2088 length:672 start_codon:yes stop_codon:yes gene_type:complete